MDTGGYGITPCNSTNALFEATPTCLRPRLLIMYTTYCAKTLNEPPHFPEEEDVGVTQCHPLRRMLRYSGTNQKEFKLNGRTKLWKTYQVRLGMEAVNAQK